MLSYRRSPIPQGNGRCMPTSLAIIEEKHALRGRMREALAGLPPARRAQEEELVTAAVQATPEWRDARTVAIYRSVATEFSTVGLANGAWRAGKTVCFPRVTQWGGLELHVAGSWAEFVPGVTYGIPEPKHDAPSVRARDVDLGIVPGLAFDAKGGRLGRGGGHFDRLVPRLDRAWAVAFDCQIVKAVPREGHDRPVDRVFHAAGVN